MRLARRQFLELLTGAATLSARPGVARAQAYPTRAITIIVPFAPGGGTDVSARVVGEYMSSTLRQQFVVENFPGAGGTTGTIRAMRASPDGYTIEMGHIGTHAVSVWLYPQLAYKPDLDFEPIGLAMETPLVIVARKDFPPKKPDYPNSRPCPGLLYSLQRAHHGRFWTSSAMHWTKPWMTKKFAVGFPTWVVTFLKKRDEDVKRSRR